MDAIRKFFGTLKRIHFWLLCVFLLGLGAGTWMSASSAIKKGFNENMSTIKGWFENAKSLENVANHPNQKFQAGMNAIIDSRKKGVYEAWQIKWDHQSQLFTWPQNMPQLVEHAKKYPVMELIDVEEHPEQDLPVYVRERYRDFIQAELKPLAEICKAKWKINTTGSLLSSVMVDDLNDTRAVVDWNVQDQAKIAELFSWKDPKTQQVGKPSTLEVYVAEENLWVLKSLMSIIKDTNGDADQRHLAPIKKIDFMRIGVAAMHLKEVGQIEPLALDEASATDATGVGGMGGMGGYGMPGMGGGMPGMGGGMPGMGGGMPGMGAGMPGMEGGYGGYSMPGSGYGGMGGMGGSFLDASDPLGNRYVDADYNETDGEELRSAVAETSLERASLAVAKRLPVRIRVLMDTRKIDKLLVACANAPLMLEVKQLRINRPPAPSVAADKTGQLVSSAAAAGSEEEMDDDEFAALQEEKMAGGGMGMPGMGGYGGYGMEGGMGMPGMGMPGMGMPGMGMPGMEGGYGGYGAEGMYGADGMGGPDDKLPRSQKSYPYDEYVEIFGVVYIYNKPNMAILGSEEEVADTGAPASTDLSLAP